MGKSYNQFSLEERCTIARLRADGQSVRQIATNLHRAPSSVARELARNTGAQIGYAPTHADDRAWARRWRGPRLARQPDLYALVMSKLVMGWSPQQIAGRLTQQNSALKISHESIYRFLYAQIAKTKDYRWARLLHSGKSKRRRKHSRHNPVTSIKDRVDITKRPAHIAARKQAGHWETDLVLFSDKKTNLLVAQERTSRFVLLAKQTTKAAQSTVARLKDWFVPLPNALCRTLTQDNGTEFYEHHQLHALGVKTFFCAPRSPWQKGGIENMNGRIRRFVPLKTKPDSVCDADIQSLADLLNATPRKCLGYKTPAEVFSSFLNPLHFKCESTFPLARA